MFLKQLEIHVGATVVREVSFRMGLNLIVDEIPEDAESEQASGNNVGKTTVLRCVDYCLGGSSKSIYIDPEFNRPNVRVLRFLEDNTPLFRLRLRDSSGTDFLLERRFGIDGGMVDGDEFAKEASYDEAVKQLIFRVQSSRPTLRELVPKFIRVDPDAKTRLLRWIMYGSDSQYEAVWLTIFGFKDPGIVKRRRDLKASIKKTQSQLKALKPLSRSPRQERPIIERNLGIAREKLASMSLEGAYDSSIEQLRSLRGRIAETNQKLANLESALGNTRRTLAIMDRDKPAIGTAELLELYIDVEANMTGSHRRYSDLVKFHEELLRNQTKFVTASEADLRANLATHRGYLNSLLAEESKILREFADPRTFADIRQLSDDIARLSQRKGELDSLLNATESLKSLSAEAQGELGETDRELHAQRELIEHNLERINHYFAGYSKQLYGDTPLVTLLDPAEHKGNYLFDIGNLEGNEGSGKKKGQIAAFDLAYLSWREEIHAKTVRFTMHDETELIDTNQLKELFRIAESIQGQYVIPMLSDRLASVDFVGKEHCVILSLSKTNRFFKLSG